MCRASKYINTDDQVKGYGAKHLAKNNNNGFKGKAHAWSKTIFWM